MVTVSNGAVAAPTVFPLAQCEPGSDGSMIYACMATDFFPESATFHWTKNGQNVLDAVQYPAVKQKTGDKYSKVSQINVNITGMDKQEIKCTVETIRSNNQSVTLPVKASPRSPTVSLLPVFTFESQNVLCVIENFYPKSLTVTWKEDNVKIEREVPLFIQQDSSGYYTAQSFLKLNKTTQGNNKMHTCEVSHMGDTFTKTKRLEGQLSVKLTPPSSRDIFLNNKVELKCITTGTDSGAVNDAAFKWKVGGNDQSSSATVEKDQLENGQSRQISKLKVDVNEWFSGKEIECRVFDKGGEEVGNPLKRIIKKGGAAPKVLIYTLPEASDPNHDSVVCEVRGSSLGDVYIMWKVDGGDFQEGNTGIVEQQDGNMSHVSILTVKKDSATRKFTCAVKHGNMGKNTSPKIVDYSKSEPGVVDEDVLHCTKSEDEEEDEYSSMWSTTTSFIFLFLFSLVYSAILSLVKIKH
ncbi:hypothetical protein AALO_G00080080 [Alosa alosa]|uniref:Ig-like domain-containing protein n=1 Tax=Alosa alosa TaxID=278164 RepID=A0AAV6GWZ8_9TELE|nr:hypothetical protein AALO_G00080080 [Alosa alosa]